MSAAIQTDRHPDDEPLAVEHVAEPCVAQDEDEIVATMLHMVETRRVRLITPALAY